MDWWYPLIFYMLCEQLPILIMMLFQARSLSFFSSFFTPFPFQTLFEESPSELKVKTQMLSLGRRTCLHLSKTSTRKRNPSPSPTRTRDLSCTPTSRKMGAAPMGQCGMTRSAKVIHSLTEMVVERVSGDECDNWTNIIL